MKQLDKIFFNTVEEMNECYGIDAELPSGLHSNADLVRYEIVEPFLYDYIGQYVFTKAGCHHSNYLGEHVIHISNRVALELGVYKEDMFSYEGRCFVYVRVNEHLRKHLEKSLLGCEFVYCRNKAVTPYRRFVHGVEARTLGIVVTDQCGLSGYLGEQLFYPDDYSDPIPYEEWVKLINKQNVEN